LTGIASSLETSWVEEMIKKYDTTARKTGSIVSPSEYFLHMLEDDHANTSTIPQIIPTIALAPSDITAYLIAKTTASQPQSKGAADVTRTAKLEI
jgi:hypothetical protein